MVDDTTAGTFTVDTVDPTIDPMADRLENSVFTQNATTSGAANHVWSYTGVGTIVFGTPNAEDTTISADTEGDYTITLDVTDAAGNTASESFILTWDTTNPTVTTPDLGTINTATASGATASDTNGIASYSWTGDAGVIFSNSSILNPSISASSDGSYSATLTVTDNAGNTNSDTMTFTWDVTGPNIDPISDRYENSIFTQTSSTTEAVTWAWSSNSPSNITFGDVNASSTTILADTDGVYTITLTTEDNLGNPAAESFTLTWDTIDPIISIADLNTINSTTTVSTTITETGSGVDIYQWTQVGGLGEVEFTDSSIQNPGVSATAEGTYTIQLEATDRATNSATGTVEFTWDVTGPSIDPMSDRYENSIFNQTSSTTEAVTWTWSSNSPSNITFGNANASSTTILADTDGVYTITLTTEDGLGNPAAESFTLTWDTVVPTVTTEAIDPNPTGDTTPSFGGNSLDDLSGVNLVEYSINQTDWFNCSSQDGGFGSNDEDYVCTVSEELVDGDHIIYIRATDRSGNISDGSLTNEFNVDTSLPGKPNISFPVGGSSIQAGDKVISWEIPSINNLSSFRVEYLHLNASSTWETEILDDTLLATSTSLNWTIATSTNIAENIIKVIAIDSFGGEEEAESGTFAIDSEAPVITNPNQSLGTINTSTSISASVSDNIDTNEELTYSWSTISEVSSGALNISNTNVLNPSFSGDTNGDYEAKLTVNDRAGNVSTSTVEFTWYVSSGGGGGGGGGGGTLNYCSDIEYGPWSQCRNNIQTRIVIGRTPDSCSLTTSQQLSLTRSCEIEPEPIVDEPEEPSSSYPFDPEAVDVIDAARDNFTTKDENMVRNLTGKIVLQVEDRGRAWYINPNNESKYYLGRPTNSFQVMRLLGTGISNKDLDKIPVGILDDSLNMDIDSDGDGLPNRLEEGLGTDLNNPDTDGDGFSDYEEVISDYNPLAPGRVTIDNEFTAKLSGKIFIQVERNGEAWYLNPDTQRRYYLGRPREALSIMRTLSLGISNEDLNKIPVGSFAGQVE
jgi:hypothetical protein